MSYRFISATRAHHVTTSTRIRDDDETHTPRVQDKTPTKSPGLDSGRAEPQNKWQFFQIKIKTAFIIYCLVTLLIKIREHFQK